LLESVLGATPQEFESPILRHADLRRRVLHGQPGSGADWQQLTRLLPAHWDTVAADRPGYGTNPQPAAGFATNARDVFAQMDSRGIQRAVLVGHSYGGGVALAAASLAPHRVEAVVLLASVGPGCVSMWDRLLAAAGIGPLCTLAAWRLTPWIARARLARLTRRQGRPLAPGEHVNWQIWARTSRDHGRLWRTFLAEQRALVHELSEVVAAIPLVQAPVLLLTDPADRLVPLGTGHQLAKILPGARLQLVEGTGHQLPIRAPDVVADTLVAFLASQADHRASGMGAGNAGRQSARRRRAGTGDLRGADDPQRSLMPNGARWMSKFSCAHPHGYSRSEGPTCSCTICKSTSSFAVRAPCRLGAIGTGVLPEGPCTHNMRF
jgi:pimeloyl-ACP methyl ester carboxylesterase